MRHCISRVQPGDTDGPRVQWLTLATQAIANARSDFDHERGRAADAPSPAN